MKKLTLLVAIMVATFSFAQDKGQWSFGIGTDFTTTAGFPEASVGYFVMDGMMVSAGFHMEMGDDGHTNWDLGARYYVTGDMFAEAHVNGMTDMDPSLAFNVGCSKELGFEGKLWFEPYVGMTMPGNDMDGHLGLGTSFRFCF